MAGTNRSIKITDRWFEDTLQNLITGMGTVKDSTTLSTYTFNELSKAQLDNAYRADWLAREIVNAPAEDMTREWRMWQASKKQIESLENLEKELRLQKKVKMASIRGRLYGGAGIVLGVDQGRADEPLDISTLKKGCLKFAVVLSRYELSAGPRNYDVESPYFGRPEYYQIASPTYGFERAEKRPSVLATRTAQIRQRQGNIFQMSSGMGISRVHPSRVIEFPGQELPDWRIATLGGGWGDSVLQTCDDTIRRFDNIAGGIASMVTDAKMDVIKIPHLSKNLAKKEYASLLIERFTLANQAKSIVNTLLLDKDEEWERVETSFGALPTLIREFMSIVAGAAHIPVSRLIGQARGRSVGGQQSTLSSGDADIRNYYDSVSTYQKTELTPELSPLDKIMQIHLFGQVDPSVYYEWAPLWNESEGDKANTAGKKAEVFKADVDMGLINEDVLRQARANQLIEDGTYPGIEDAIDQFGLEPPIPEARGWSPGIDPNTGLPLPQAIQSPQQPKALPPPDLQQAKQPVQDATPRTLYVRRQVLNADRIVRWAKEAGFAKTVPAEQMHVTIVYSRAAVDWMKIGTDWGGPNGDGQLKIATGGPRLMERFNQGAVVLMFGSQDLQWRHDYMVRQGARHDFPDYQPHITITFDPGDCDWRNVEPYQGPIILGPEIFEEVKDGWKNSIVEDVGPPDEPRDDHGKWTSGAGSSGHSTTGQVEHVTEGKLSPARRTALRSQLKRITSRMGELEDEDENIGVHETQIETPKEKEYAALRFIRSVADSDLHLPAAQRKNWHFAYAWDREGNVVGAVSIQKKPNGEAQAMYLGSLAKGAGSTLMKTAENAAKNKWGTKTVVLTATPAAQGFYKKNGYELDPDFSPDEGEFRKTLKDATGS